MKQFLERVILDNQIKSYLIVIGIILVAYIIKRVISRYLATILFTMVNKSGKTKHRASFISMVVKPLDFFLVLFIGFIAIDRLRFPQYLNIKIYKATSQQIVECIATSIFIIAFIRLVLKIIDFLAMVLEERAQETHDQTDNQLVVFFKDFFKVVTVLIGILLVLRFAFNRDINNLFTGLSIVGAAIALATRESLENLIASFIIFFDKPFTTGDVVKVNSFTGTVERIGLRSTRIRTDMKTYITVPNKQMVDTILDNISLRTQRKVELRLEIGLSATSQQLRQLVTAIKDILTKQAAVESKSVYVMETGKNAHIIAVDYFTTMPQEMETFNEIRQAVNLAIIDYLEQSRIELAAANTDIKIHNAN